eukprot:scaffold33252_cov107-Isochrysis_galbana.AAC.1
MGWPDTTVVDGLICGFPTVGHYPETGIFRRCDRPAAHAFECLDHRGHNARLEGVLRRLAQSEAPSVRAALEETYRLTRKEVEQGLMRVSRPTSRVACCQMGPPAGGAPPGSRSKNTTMRTARRVARRTYAIPGGVGGVPADRGGVGALRRASATEPQPFRYRGAGQLPGRPRMQNEADHRRCVHHRRGAPAGHTQLSLRPPSPGCVRGLTRASALPPCRLPQLRTAITGADSIKAVGAGMSWSQNHFACADSGGINIVTAGLCSDIDLTAAKPFYLAPAGGSRAHVTDDIVVDEDTLTVVVKSCVTVQALLEYLAHYRTPTFVSGYTLESPSTFYAGMTVGGAVAGGTHGVSLSHGGWAGKVLEVQAMLADGSIAKVNKNWRPRLFRALKAGAGRLGVLLDVKLGIIVQGDVEEEQHQMDVDEYRKQVRLTKSLIDRAMTSRANNGNEAQWRHLLSESELHDRHTVLHVRQGEGRVPKFVTRKWSFFPRGREAKFRPDSHHQSPDMNMLKWLAYLDGTNWGSDGWSVEEGSYAPAHSWDMALATETETHGDHLCKNMLNNPGDPDDL